MFAMFWAEVLEVRISLCGFFLLLCNFSESQREKHPSFILLCESRHLFITFALQVLNEYFHNVCELDLVFNFYKVSFWNTSTMTDCYTWWSCYVQLDSKKVTRNK